MKWLTLDYIKAHSRIDYDGEDDLLTLYANAAEQTVLNLCNRSYDEMMEKYGEDTTTESGDVVKTMPATIMQATLMLVDNSYQQRSPASAQSLHLVPYTFYLLIKPYIKLVD